MPPSGKNSAHNVEGAWASALHGPYKMALLATPQQFERYVRFADLAATLLERGLISKEFYRRVVADDPIRSLARQAERSGTADWARRIYDMADATVPVAAASRILGVDSDTGRPIFKKERGVPDEPLRELLDKTATERTGTPARQEGPATLEDGITIHPDRIRSAPLRRAPVRPQRPAREGVRPTWRAPKF